MTKVKTVRVTPAIPKGWSKLDGLQCPKCKSLICGYKEDDRGDFEDHCFTCGKTWWVDGPDY